MITNFSHMDKWPDIYEELLRIEDLILGESKKGYTDNNLRVMMAARPIVEKMCRLLVEVNGITDEKIKTVIKATNPQRQMRLSHIGLFEYILALREGEYISENSAMHLQKIRMIGGKAINQNRELYSKSSEEHRQMAEELYELLYHETYLFANQYMPEAQARANKQGKECKRYNPEGKAAGAKSSVLGRVVTIVVIVLFVLACVGLAIAIF